MSDNETRLIAELRTYARSLCSNKTEADNIIKQALENALHTFPNTNKEGNLRIDLLRIIRKRYYGNITNQKSDESHLIKYPVFLYHCGLGEDSLSMGQIIGRAIQQLPIHYREAIVLMVILEKSHGSAAAIMECEVETAAYRLDQARRMLKIQLRASSDQS